jgi:hypothetical protein
MIIIYGTPMELRPREPVRWPAAAGAVWLRTAGLRSQPALSDQNTRR